MFGTTVEFWTIASQGMAVPGPIVGAGLPGLMNRQHQAAMRAGSIGPGILEALETGTALGNRRDHVEQVAR